MKFLVCFLLISTLTYGQEINIRGITFIETDKIISDSVNHSPNTAFEKRIKLKPIEQAEAQVEIRFYEHFGLSNSRNLKRLFLKDSTWNAIGYYETKKSKIKKHRLIPKTSYDTVLKSIIVHNLFSLPTQSDLREKMRKIFIQDGVQYEKKIAVLDGSAYTIEFKVNDVFRIYRFNNPDTYAKFYEDVPELKEYVAIVKIFTEGFKRK